MMLTAVELPELVKRILAAQPVVDMHTHLYPPSFGSSGPDGLMLWGLDDLVTYHYLVAEVFRAVPATKFPYAQFWAMTKSERADHIWQQLFVERTPLSEACRGVVLFVSGDVDFDLRTEVDQRRRDKTRRECAGDGRTVSACRHRCSARAARSDPYVEVPGCRRSSER